VDISKESIAHASERYQADNLEFQVADVCNLPFKDNEFECIVSFETLEHLEDQSGLLKEFRRVLGPDGFLLISSPDKAVYSDRHQNKNEFHVRELYRDELETLLAGQFPACRLLRQKLVFHSAIWSEEASPRVALFDDAEESVYEHYYHEIRKNMSTGELLASMERQLEELKAAVRETSPGPQSPGRWWQRLFRSS